VARPHTLARQRVVAVRVEQLQVALVAEHRLFKQLQAKSELEGRSRVRRAQVKPEALGRWDFEPGGRVGSTHRIEARKVRKRVVKGSGQGAEVAVFCADTPAKVYDVIPTIDRVLTSPPEWTPDAVILVDCGEARRAGRAGALMEALPSSVT